MEILWVHTPDADIESLSEEAKQGNRGCLKTRRKLNIIVIQHYKEEQRLIDRSGKDPFSLINSSIERTTTKKSVSLFCFNFIIILTFICSLTLTPRTYLSFVQRTQTFFS